MQSAANRACHTKHNTQRLSACSGYPGSYSTNHKPTLSGLHTGAHGVPRGIQSERTGMPSQRDELQEERKRRVAFPATTSNGRVRGWYRARELTRTHLVDDAAVLAGVPLAVRGLDGGVLPLLLEPLLVLHALARAPLVLAPGTYTRPVSAQLERFVWYRGCA